MIMDVVNAEQARIAEEAGACAVMALERVPADIRRDGVCYVDAVITYTTVARYEHGSAFSLQGVARMSDPKLIKEIQAAVTIPVMAKVRIGHYVEAQVQRVVPCRATVTQVPTLGIATL